MARRCLTGAISPIRTEIIDLKRVWKRIAERLAPRNVILKIVSPTCIFFNVHSEKNQVGDSYAGQTYGFRAVFRSS